MGDVVVSRCGDAYVALATQGGWDIAPATDKFPDYYGVGGKRRRDLAGSWVAVPRLQPANVALVAGRRAEDGELHFTGGDGARADFLPGRNARISGRPVDAAAYPRMETPFLSSPSPGRWSFKFEKFLFRFEPTMEPPRPRPAP
jgi:hypothetical protein